jgi:hypothetical protein
VSHICNRPEAHGEHYHGNGRLCRGRTPSDVITESHKGLEGYVIASRYVRDDGRIVRHIYLNKEEQPFPTRAKAQTVQRRSIRRMSETHGFQTVEHLIQSGRLEVAIVKIVTGYSEH